MSTHSTDGREWATVDRTYPGDTLEPDGGFTCIQAGANVKVEIDEHGLFVKCDEGQHYLDGQLNDAGTHYVGFWKVGAP